MFHRTITTNDISAQLQNLVEGGVVVTTHRLLLEDEYGTLNHRINVLILSVPEQKYQNNFLIGTISHLFPHRSQKWPIT
jgi:hypothetical protein